MTEERMLYRQYKQSYADCATVPGTYDKTTKSIVVIIPEGRKKPSGVRGKSYRYIWFDGINKNDGREVRICIKAIDRAHAVKRLPIEYPNINFEL